MTSKDFLASVSSQKRFHLVPYDRMELNEMIQRNYAGSVTAEKILDFFCNTGRVSFSRKEIKSGDILDIQIRCMAYSFYWEDIDSVVFVAIIIKNCSGLIEHFYISERGEFYDEKHNLRARNSDELFDYLLNVEYDFHAIISERTYRMLRNAGWYEGRRVEVSVFSEQMKRNGIVLTQAQLDFFAEFAGLDFDFDDEPYDWHIHRLEDIIKHIQKEKAYYYIKELKRNGEVIGENLIEAGRTQSGIFFISADGRLIQDNLLGRTTMEGINHLANNVPNYVEF